MDPRKLSLHTTTFVFVLLVAGAAFAALTWTLSPAADDRPLEAVGTDDPTGGLPNASEYVEVDQEHEPPHYVYVHANKEAESYEASVLVSLERDPGTGEYVLDTRASDQGERIAVDTLTVAEASGLVEVLVKEEGDSVATPLITVTATGTTNLTVNVAENPVNNTETAVVDLKNGIVTIVEDHHEIPLDGGVSKNVAGVHVSLLNGSHLLTVDTGDNESDENDTDDAQVGSGTVTSTIGSLQQTVEGAEVNVANLPDDAIVTVTRGGQELLRVKVVPGDGATLPHAEATAYDEDGAVLHRAKVSGPLEVVGPVDDPRGIRVLHPEGGTLLALESTATGEWQLTALDETHVLAHDALRLEGNLLGPGDLKIHVKMPDGQRSTYTVDRDGYTSAVADLAREQGQDPDPVLEVIENLEDPPGFFTHLAYVINGNSKELQPDALTGDHWISGRQDTVFAARVAEPSPYDRVVVRYEVGSTPEPGDDQVQLEDTGTVEEGGRWYESPGANLPGTASQTLHFEVLYEVSRTPFVVVAQRDDLNGTPYQVRVDDHEPTATVTSPGESAKLSFEVSWSGADEGSGVDTYQVQKRVGGQSWETWLSATPDGSATFTGTDGTTYGFRVRAVDEVGHVGDWSTYVHTTIDLPDPDEGASTDDGDGSDTGDDGNDTTDDTTGGDADPTVNEPPQVQLTQPSGGQELAGVVTVKWSASDPDGTVPSVSRLEVSGDGGGSWTTIAAGATGATQWDTRDFDDGDQYELRIRVTDGSLTGFDQVSDLTVDNVRPMGDASDGGGGGNGDGGSGGGDGPTGGGGGGGDNGVPAAGVAATLLAGVGAAAARARRRR